MPRALVVYAHPCEESFNAALHRETVAALTRGGWEVDDCDLYAEGFDPVLDGAQRARVRGFYHEHARFKHRPVSEAMSKTGAEGPPNAVVLSSSPSVNFEAYPRQILKGFLRPCVIPRPAWLFST